MIHLSIAVAGVALMVWLKTRKTRPTKTQPTKYRGYLRE